MIHFARSSSDWDEQRSPDWFTPRHPLFEAGRRHALAQAREHFAQGASFYPFHHGQPMRLDFYQAEIVDGLGKTERELSQEPRQHKVEET